MTTASSWSIFTNDQTIISAEFGPECTTIPSSAFQNCTKITEINDDNVIQEIKDNAFNNTGLTKVSFNKVTSIGSGAFQDCTNLTNIYIPECTTIGSKAFQNCKELTNIDIPKCTTIGSSAFNSCTSLTKLNLKKCNQINDEAFYGCNNLRQVTLTCCSSIGSHAFSKCESLSKVYIKNSNIFCELKDKYVFCDHTSDSDPKNHNITFYINPLLIGEYKNDDNWKHYEDNMQVAPNDYSILYESSYPESDEQADNKLMITDDYTDYTHKTTNIGGIIDFSKTQLDTLEYPLFTENTNTYLTYIYLSNTFKKIGDNVFAGCENLKDIILSEDLTSIGKYAFENCKSLTTIEIPESVEMLDEGAFAGCINLKDIILSEDLTSIGKYAFENCKSLTTIEIPESVEMLDEGAFAGCEKLEKFEGKFATYNGRALVNGNCLISVVPIDNSNTEGRIHKISEIDTAISYLGKSCFQGCKNMIRVDISPDVIEIGDYAFKDCENLREIHFEGKQPPTEIGDNIFDGINSDFKIFVPLNSFGKYYNCEKLKNYKTHIYPKPDDDIILYYTTTSEEVQDVFNKFYSFQVENDTLETKVFQGRTDITKVILGEGITKISESAFEGCTKLEYIYLSDDILELNHKCFYGCENLTRIHIPYGSYVQLTNIIPPLTNTKSVIGDFINPQKPITNYIFKLTSFGDEIFYGCSNLKEFGTYHKGCVSDDNKCYIQNSKLMFFAGYIDEEIENYIIPSNIASINKSAFGGCVNLKKVSIPEDSLLEEICEKSFYKCINLIEINLPQSLKSIGMSAFDGCVNLKKVSIPEDSLLEEICEKSFYGCTALTLINLPQSLKSIGMSAFEGCTNMYINNIPNNVSYIGEKAFSECNALKCVDNDKNETPLKLNITNIYENTFYNCKSLTSVDIINSDIDIIYDSAFEGCVNLRTVSIPENSSLSMIGNSSFKNCTSLEYIYIPDTLTHIGMSAFENCTSYRGSHIDTKESIYLILNNISNLGDSCFKDSGINNLRIEDTSNILEIPKSAFENCMQLEKVVISKKITTLKEKSFNGCKNLSSYNSSDVLNCINLLDSNIEVIEDEAFGNCDILNIYLNKSLKTLGNLCLSNTNSNKLTKIYINKNVNTPPKFSNEKAYPFGKPIVEKFTILPIIYVDNLSQKTKYQIDNDWYKYYPCFKTNNDMEKIPTFPPIPPILDWKPIDIPNKDG